MRHSALLLLVFSLLFVLAGCQSAASAAPSTRNGATPTSALAPTATLSPGATLTPGATPTPTSPARCPQLSAAASGSAPTAPLSLYVETSDDVFEALNASDGSVRWKADIAAVGGLVSSLAVEQDVLYIVTGQGAVSALNAADGALRWCDLEGSALTMPSVPATPALVVDQDMLYLSGGTTVVLALTASDGTQQWKKQAQGTPVVLAAVDGQVYVQVQGNGEAQTLSVLDASTGNERWHLQSDTFLHTAADAIGNGMVYVDQSGDFGNSDTLYALRASDGKQQWHVKSQGLYFGGAVVVDDLVYETDTQGVYAFNASDGSPAWQTQHGSMANFGPAVADGGVYIGDESNPPGTVFAFSASSGKQQWQTQLTLQALLSLTPASSSTGIRFLDAAGGVVYVSHDSVTVALDGSSGKKLWSATGAAQLLG